MERRSLSKAIAVAVIRIGIRHLQRFFSILVPFGVQPGSWGAQVLDPDGLIQILLLSLLVV